MAPSFGALAIRSRPVAKTKSQITRASKGQPLVAPLVDFSQVPSLEGHEQGIDQRVAAIEGPSARDILASQGSAASHRSFLTTQASKAAVETSTDPSTTPNDKENEDLAFAILENERLQSRTATTPMNASSSLATPLRCSPTLERKRASHDVLAEDMTPIELDPQGFQLNFQVSFGAYPRGGDLISGCILPEADCMTPTALMKAIQLSHRDQFAVRRLDFTAIHKTELWLPKTNDALARIYATTRKGDDIQEKQRVWEGFVLGCKTIARAEADKNVTSRRIKERVKKKRPRLRDGGADDDLKRELDREDYGPGNVILYAQVKLYI